jgi:pimeloyl-ACP methyl ester carboxylesterase
MKKHIYFVSGTGANSKIFERIELPEKQFEMHFLEWILPLSKNETVESYALRMSEKIQHPSPILVGVSFGGIIVQEMSKIKSCEKIVLISSIKNKYELPKKLRIIRDTKTYLLAPTTQIKNIENLISFIFGDKSKKRIEAYQSYLSVRNPLYLNWAIKQALIWNQTEVLPNTIHIHGDQDPIFPIKYIKDCITIPKGSHIMIITKAKKISSILLNNLQ